MVAASIDVSSPGSVSAVHRFGRFQLLRLLGRSERTMAWQVAEPDVDRQLMLVLPRLQPAGAEALATWQRAVAQAARLSHPQLARVLEHGVQDGWPFVLHDLEGAATLGDRLPPGGVAGAEAAAWAVQGLQGLAFAHDAGVAHHDLQPYLMLLDDRGRLRLCGLAVAAEVATSGDAARDLQALDARSLQARRQAAEADVLGSGVILHAMLAGPAVLSDADVGRVCAALPPEGRESLRLPWTTLQPVPEPLRAIVDRATDRQPRLRYRSARTLLRALEGWLRAEAESGGGPLALLLDRLQTVGALPSSPGAAARVARLALMERERTIELAEVVLEDIALSFEMLRLVNTAQVRGAQLAGAGPVLTVRRAIALLGLSGVRRAALALRNWPGPLQPAAAQDLRDLYQRCLRAARTAVALRPAGYDAEVVFLLTLLQNLGRLVLQYHFADEAQQIRQLQEPLSATEPGDPGSPGMSEEAACQAVLGVDAELFGSAVARHWGFDSDVLPMIRRHALAVPVRSADDDADMLRITASCANEAVDALALPARLRAIALERVTQRYGRLLHFSGVDLEAALKAPMRGPLDVVQSAGMIATNAMPASAEASIADDKAAA